MYGCIVEKCSVCDGISLAYSYILNKLNILNYIVIGDLDNVPHALNAVCINNVWCYIDVTNDLKYAKVYYSAMMGDPKEVAKGLKSSAGFLRRQLAQRMNLRMTPELTFIRDTSLAHGAHIASVLHKIEEESPHIFDEVKHFFTVYKQLENKQTAVKELFDRDEAIEIVRRAIDDYNKLIKPTTKK